MVAPDGCPVEAYAALPAEPELSAVLAHLRGRHTVLDLGAGAGRIADPLAQAGYDVLAVDESAEMLGAVRQARTAQSRIEDFRSAERFDAVLLLSHLINSPGDPERQALLTTAARHLAPEGMVLVQRHDPGRALAPGRTILGDVEVSLLDVDVSRWPTVQATTRYRLGTSVWDQPWQAVVLDDDGTSRALQASGLRPLLMDGAWVVAGRDAA